MTIRAIITLSCTCTLLPVIPGACYGAAAQEVFPLIPYPKALTPVPGTFTISADTRIVLSPQISPDDANGVGILQEDIEAAARLQIASTQAETLPGRDVIAFDGFGSYPLIVAACRQQVLDIPADLPAEGYVISIRPDRVLVGAADRRGLVCAALTLAQLWQADGQTLKLACCDIVDYPTLEQRICHMQVPALTVQGWNLFEWRAQQDPEGQKGFETMAEHMPILEHMTRLALRQKLNAVMIDLCNVFRFESYPDMALPQAVPLAALKPIVDMCRRYYAEPIPGLNLFAHQEHFLAQARPDLMLVKLAEFPKKRVSRYEDFFYWEPVYDPNHPEVRKIVTAVLDETLELFSPHYLHIGHDECGALAFVPRQNDKEITALFSGSVNFLHGYLKQHGVRTMMWSDMLLGQRMFPSGAAHGTHQGAPIAPAIGDIPKDIIITDWHYYPFTRPYPDQGGPRDDFPSSLYFTDQGFDVIGTTLGKLALNARQVEKLARNQAHARNFTKYVAALNPEPEPAQGKGLGMMVSHWYLGPRWLPPLRHGRCPSIQAAAEQFWNGGARRDPVHWPNGEE